YSASSIKKRRTPSRELFPQLFEERFRGERLLVVGIFPDDVLKDAPRFLRASRVEVGLRGAQLGPDEAPLQLVVGERGAPQHLPFLLRGRELLLPGLELRGRDRVLGPGDARLRS